VRLETAAYRAIARLAARSLGTVDSVLGVYTRRSVAAGDVVFGRSDIDLHAIVAPPASLEAEGLLLLDLADRFRRLKRLAPCLGHFDVSTPAELSLWYREQPSQWFRDRGWLRLQGEEFERPRLELDGAGRSRALWWYFWAAQQLPRNFAAGNARTCCNLVLDMFDAYRLYSGLSHDPLSRAELAELWYASGPPSPERAAILRAHRHGFRGHRGTALAQLYRESLALHDTLYAHVSGRLEGAATGRLESRVPPSFTARTYVLVDPANRPAVDAALDSMRRDATIWVLTEAGLKLYLLFRNPWEHAPLSAANPRLDLAPPPRKAYLASVRSSLYREIPRHYGFIGEHRHIGPLYAQGHLYASDELVASDPGELERGYRRRYGVELRTDVSQAEYFRARYATVCQVIDELRAGPCCADPAR